MVKEDETLPMCPTCTTRMRIGMSTKGVRAYCPNYAYCGESMEPPRRKKTPAEPVKQNPAFFCACGKYIGQRGFCSKECEEK